MSEAESGENACNVGIMGEVEVEGLIEGKGHSIVIEGDIILSSGARDCVVGQAREDFFNVADADCAACRRLEVVVACEVKVNGVFKALPFGVGEEIAEGAVSIGHCLIRT